MRVVVPLFLLVACSQAPQPTADPNGPHGANETVTAHGGSLQLDAFPQNGVEVQGEKIYLWVFVEGASGTSEALAAQAKEQAQEELKKFIEVAAQQLDLQLQASGQDSASNDEMSTIRTHLASTLTLGEGERAWQNLTREDQPLCRVFMRFTLNGQQVVSSLEQGLGTRKNKNDVARRVLASFDSN